MTRLSDNCENIGANLVLQSAAKTDSRAGDGTTTSTVLTQALVNEGLRFVSNGHNAVALQRGLLKSSAYVVKKIREMATPVTSYEQYKYIASLSAASEEYGTVIADAITRVGADGAIVVAPAQGLEDELLFTEGTGLCRKQAGRRPLSAPGHASGCPGLRLALANQPFARLRPATSGLLPTQAWVSRRATSALSSSRSRRRAPPHAAECTPPPFWQRPSSAPVPAPAPAPAQGAPASPGRLHAPRAEAGPLGAPRRRLGCSSEPPPTALTPLPLAG